MGVLSLSSQVSSNNFRMSFDLYTQNISLTQKAKFWTNYVSALKGQEPICAGGEGESLLWYPSVWENVPSECRDLKKEIGKIEDQMLSRKRQATPLTPVLPDAHDKIVDRGFSYEPLHTQIYGTFKARTARISYIKDFSSLLNESMN